MEGPGRGRRPDVGADLGLFLVLIIVTTGVLTRVDWLGRDVRLAMLTGSFLSVVAVLAIVRARIERAEKARRRATPSTGERTGRRADV